MRYERFWRITLGLLAVVAAALLCRRVVLTTPNKLLEQLSNLIRIFLYIGLFSFWGISVSQRVIQPRVRSMLEAVAVLMIFWLTIREFRWHLVVNPDVKRLLWYVYYIPILLIPLTGLFIAISLGKGDGWRIPKPTALPVLISLALSILVLTNDLHGGFFIFPERAAMESDLDYHYGALFYLLVLWVLLLLLAAFGTMLKKCRIPRSGKIIWLPMAPFGAALLYFTLYAARVPFVVSVLGDFAVFGCLACMLFFESCIQCGLIQSNSRYFDLFLASEALPARITDEAFETRFAAGCAPLISREDMLRAKDKAVYLDDGTELHNMPVNGGFVIWTEDVSELLALRDSLAETRDELREREHILRMEYEQEAEYRRVAEQNRLYDLLQEKTQSRFDRVGELALKYEAAGNPEEKRSLLLKIIVLGSYIKRRRDFVLLMEGAEEITGERLESALEESFRALSLMGIRGACLVEARGRRGEGSGLTLAYDFFEAVAEALLDTAHYLTVRVCAPEGGLRCVIWADSAENTEELQKRYPKARILPDGEGGAEYVLELDP